MQKELSKLTPIPRGVPLNKALTRERLEAMQACIIALAEGKNLDAGGGLRKRGGHGKMRLDLDVVSRRFFQTPSPFWPSFFIKDPTAEAVEILVTVSDGTVVDHDPLGASEGGAAGEALFYYKCANRMNGDEEKEFPVSSGDSVYVRVPVKKTGAINTDEVGDPPAPEECSIMVGAEGSGSPPLGVSKHWWPEIEAGEGADSGEFSYGDDGAYFYKLATVTMASDGTLEVEYFLAGDNIQHYRELPMFEHVGTGLPTFKQFNPTTAKYECYSIKGVGGVTVALVDDTLEVSGGGGGDKHLDLTVSTIPCQLSTGGDPGGSNKIIVTGSTDKILYRWRFGDYVGQFAWDAEAMACDEAILAADAFAIKKQNVTDLSFAS